MDRIVSQFHRAPMFDFGGSLKGAIKLGTFVNVALLKGGYRAIVPLPALPRKPWPPRALKPNHCAIIARSNVTRSKQKAQQNENRRKAIDCELTSRCLPAQRWQGLQAATTTRTNHKTPDSKAQQLSYPRRILLVAAFLLQQHLSGVEL
jgi:hypothetical protein